MGMFEEVYERWLNKQIEDEKNSRRRELLKRGLSHGTVELLRLVWFPAVGNLDHLHAEYEVRDMNNRFRYLDTAYLPGHGKGCIEVQDFKSHARDIDSGRFKDLCMKQALLTLDDWQFLPIAFLSIRDDTAMCKQLVLSFVGKFMAMKSDPGLNWAEAETIRYATRVVRDFEPRELAAHLCLSENRTRVILRSLLSKKQLEVASGNQRYRTYRLYKR